MKQLQYTEAVARKSSEKNCSEIFRKIYKKTLVLESLS